MSEGPIAQARKAYGGRGKTIAVADRVHFPSTYPNRGYCGTNDAQHVTRDRAAVSCPNCHAALAADDQARAEA